MTANQHAREARALVSDIADPSRADSIALAQVHATLALADATLRAACIRAVPLTEYRYARGDETAKAHLPTEIEFPEHTLRAMKALYLELTGNEW